MLLLVWLEGRSEVAPVFAPPTIDPQGNVHVVLLDDSSMSYVIEVSTNLTNWSPVLTNTTSGGRLELTQALDSAVRFYRARIDPSGGEPPPVVIPIPDPAQQTVGVVGPGGGDLTLLSEAGVLYTLSFPTNAVSAPVQVSMTLVTNLVGQPFADTNWSAVVFEPSGLELLSPAQLTIQYFYESPPTNLASFWFSGDGTDFGLVPDQLFSNRVEFAVYHFSGVGAAHMTPAEYQSQRSHRVNSRLDNLNQVIAQELKPSRDSGQPPSPDVLSRCKAYLDGYIQNLLDYAPRLSADCDFARSMIPKMEAAQAINWRYGLGSPLIDSLRALECSTSERCARIIAFECKAGGADVYRRVREWESLAALSGCKPVPDSDLKDCLPAWYGSFNYFESSGSSMGRGSDALGFYTERGRHYVLGLSGEVTKATEYPPDIFHRLNVILEVTASMWSYCGGVEFSDSWGGCENNPSSKQASRTTSDVQASGRVDTNGVLFGMTLIQLNSPNAPLTVNFSPPPPLNVPINGRDYLFMTDCYERVLTNRTKGVTNSIQVAVPGFNDPNPVIQVTTNSIKLHYHVERYVDFTGTTITSDWRVDLKRRPN